MNRSFTSRSQGSVSKSMLRFVVVILFCYFASYTIGRNLVEWMLSNSDLTSGIKTDIAVFISRVSIRIELFVSKIICF